MTPRRSMGSPRVNAADQAVRSGVSETPMQKAGVW
jgi:hypothetical protein